MSVHSPVRSIQPLPPNADASSSSVTLLSPRPVQARNSHTSPRQFTRSEKMLLATLRRADEQDNDSDNDYFDMSRDLLRYGERHHSRSASHNGSPVRPLKRNTSSSQISHTSRPASPSTSRFVERERASRRRTPSPSPHPYLSPRSNPPPMQRTQTAPAPLSQHLGVPSRPSTPSARRSSSPARSSHQHSRYRSPSASHSKVRTPQEDLLRARLEGVLAANPSASNSVDTVDASSNNPSSYGATTMAQYGVMTPLGRSRGPSISSTFPPMLAPVSSTPAPHVTAPGDQWTWNAGTTAYSLSAPAAQHPSSATISVPTSPRSQSRRAPSVSRTQAVPQGSSSPTTSTKARSPVYYPHEAMITPPPSPPFDDDNSSITRSSSSQALNSSSGLGLGHPSAPSARPPMQSSTACFDARSASLMLREQSGYVSFCDIEGLGEPSQGVDGEDDGESDGPRGRGRWWEVWRK